jgi:pyrroline-5-carboxylate reductase
MNIAILGTGNMGRAIISGLERTYGGGIKIAAWDKNGDALRGLGPRVAAVHPREWFTPAPDAVVLAVKPFDMESALAPVIAAGGTNATRPLWISIAAGRSIAALQKMLPEGSRICRVMPNTPAVIGEAISVYALGENATEEDGRLAEKIFKACGKTVQAPEKFMNAATGLSGSGPAYVFFFLESLVEAGVVAGLPEKIARECALQTVIGAAKMALESPDNFADLKMKVMTPAGTTASACMVLEQNAFKHTIIKAVVAATKRAEQLEK